MKQKNQRAVKNHDIGTTLQRGIVTVTTAEMTSQVLLMYLQTFLHKAGYQTIARLYYDRPIRRKVARWLNELGL